MANTSNAITIGFARYVVTVVSASARDTDSLVSIVDAVLVLDDALLVLVLDEELLVLLVLGGGGGGVLLVELVPGLGGEVLFVVFTVGGPSTTSSIGVDKPKTVTLPTYTPGSLGALNLIGNLTSEVVLLAPGGMMMLNV
jgi:hypothetical protein